MNNMIYKASSWSKSLIQRRLTKYTDYLIKISKR